MADNPEQVCDECARLFQVHVPRWTKDGRFFYCGQCKGFLGGEGWRQADWNETPAPIAADPDPEPEPEKSETCNEFLARMDRTFTPRAGNRPARRVENSEPDTSGLYEKFKPMEKEKKKTMASLWVKKKKPPVETLPTPDAEDAAPESAPTTAEPAKPSKEERRREYQRRWREKKRAETAAPAEPKPKPARQVRAEIPADAPAQRYTATEWFGLLSTLRGMSEADRKILLEMI